MSSSLTVNRLTKGRTASSSAGPLIQNWSGVTVHTSSGLAGCRRTFQNISSIHALLEGLHRNLDGFSILTGGVSSSLVTRINQTCNVGLIKTDHGPLTKGRGDGVLADPSDVTVTVEDTERNVQDVDPLLGLILLKGGVEAGSDVSVDYHSTDTPYVYPSFNDNGFLFNQFEERQSGYTFSHIPLIGPNRNPPQPSKSS